jgi:hypothetical protein
MALPFAIKVGCGRDMERSRMSDSLLGTIKALIVRASAGPRLTVEKAESEGTSLVIGHRFALERRSSRAVGADAPSTGSN